MISPSNDIPFVFKVSEIPGMRFATKNFVPGYSVYGERLVNHEGVEYRIWDHRKSKLASGFIRGLRIPELKKDTKILYLGASSGTTVSHLSDIVGKNGIIYAIEFSPRMTRDLLNVARDRTNLIPILADARYPSQYTHLIDQVDLLYCDVAQPNQSDLFINNAKVFLKANGIGFIAIKTRSISQKSSSREIFKEQVKVLEEGGFKTKKTFDISRIHKQHYVYLGRFSR